MAEGPNTLSWVVGGVLMIVFAWTALSLMVDNLPWKLVDKSRPGQKIFGIVLMIVTGAFGLKICKELLYWVWRGLKHILLLDMGDI